MSKKNYQAIAGALYHAARVDPAFSGETRNGVLFELCRVFKEDNHLFDRARFIEACETGMCKGMPKRPETLAAHTCDSCHGIHIPANRGQRLCGPCMMVKQ